MDPNEQVEKFLAFMAEHGFSNTGQRRAIAQAFFSWPGHHTLEEFYQHINGIDPGIGQTTVYRTLKLLCAAGFATEIQFADNITRYEVARPKAHHDHLLCLECGRIVEVYDPRLEEIESEIAAKNKFSLRGHTHNMYGICGACQPDEPDNSDNADGQQMACRSRGRLDK